MILQWSTFNIIERVKGGYVIRNMMTGAMVFLDSDTYQTLGDLIKDSEDLRIEDWGLNELVGSNSILVPSRKEELVEYKQMFFSTRESLPYFTLHLLPTIACQMACSYCFEDGSNRMGIMSDSVLSQSIQWLDSYFSNHDLQRFKIVLFGGEPLLGKRLIRKALPKLFRLGKKHNLDCFTELVSNGELLDEETAKLLHEYSLIRVQITLDGDQDTHDSIRCGKDGRPTFNRIISNVLMLLENNYIKAVDLRINYSEATAESVIKLLQFLSTFKLQDRMNLSFGLIMPTQNSISCDFLPAKEFQEKENAELYISFCQEAQNLGFAVPVEYLTGPWCVAVEKHTVVLQPNGAIQKCICTVGREEYDFSNTKVGPEAYARDERFEKFQRANQCYEERCPYIPVCSGGCPWDALVAYGENGFQMRFCQKEFLDIVNRGLLRLSYQK